MAGTPLAEASIPYELLVELSFGRKFEHEEDTFTVVEITIKTQDIGVSTAKLVRVLLQSSQNAPQILLDFDFSSYLLFHATLNDLAFV